MRTGPRESIVENLIKQVRNLALGFINHNTLTGLQGGTANQYFHLTNAQATDVGNLGTAAFEPASAFDAAGEAAAAEAAANTYTDNAITAAGITRFNNPHYQAPVNGDFAWVNQQGASVTVRSNGGIFLAANPTTTDQVTSRVKAAPATPYTLTAHLTPNLWPANFLAFGLCFRESGTGKLETFYWVNGNTAQPLISIDKWSSNTVNVGNRAFTDWDGFGGPANWLQIADDGTNIFYRISTDGEYFYTIANPLRGNHFTVGPDQIGFMVNAANASFGCGGLLLSWKET